MTRIARALWVTGGTVCVILAVLGLFLPILPTTPFLLLGALCYARGSARLHQWLVYRSPLGGYIRDYRDRHGMAWKHKVWTVALLWLTIGYSIAFVATAWWLRLLLALIALGVTIHISRIKTLYPAPEGTDERGHQAESADGS